MKHFRIQFLSPMFILGRVITLAALGTGGTVWGGTDVGNGFGMVGVVRGQTARLNAANLGGPDTHPCAMKVMFVDDQGNSLLEDRSMIIDGGKSAFLDLNADALGGPDTRPGERFQIRAAVNTLGGPDTKGRCRQTIRLTLEVFDNDTGKTMAVIVGTPNE